MGTFCFVRQNMVNVIFYLLFVPIVKNSIIPKTFKSKEEQQDEDGSRRGRQFFIDGLIGPNGPIQPYNRWGINPAFFALPTIIGIGASLAWLALQRVPITTNISDIGSPSTNVTVGVTNTNQQTVSQTQTAPNTATNTNNDNDNISQTNTVTINNTNNGKK